MGTVKVKDLDTKESREMEGNTKDLWAQSGFGFMNKESLRTLADNERLTPVLVRCGGGRFTCPAQDAEHFIEIIEREGTDYVRDVSVVPSSRSCE